MNITKINNTNIHNIENKDKRPKGTFQGYCTYAGFAGLGGTASFCSGTVFRKMQNNITPEVTVDIHKKLALAIKDSGLADKVCLNIVPEKSHSHLNKFTKNILEGLHVQYALEAGKKAFFTHLFGENQTIHLPEKKLALCGFHELGHAKNFQSKFGKLLNHLNATKLPLTIAAWNLSIALFTKRRTPDEKDKDLSLKDKFVNFTKNHAGKILLIASTPMLIDEGLASLRGHNIAKKYLSKELLKTYDKICLTGFATYALLTAGLTLGAYFGIKVKDHVAGTTPNKHQSAKTN